MGKVIMSGIVPQLTNPGAIMASQLAVGSTVKLLENGSPVEYLVVNQGIPSGSSLYDSSCNGTWLMLKNWAENHVWDSTDSNYKNSDIHAWLNADYLARFDSKTQEIIRQVKIPYVNGTSSISSVVSGANGLSTKVFLLSVPEAGVTGSSDGAVLEYFANASNDRREWGIQWWLRSPKATDEAQMIGLYGGLTNGSNEVHIAWGVRPVIVIEPTALFYVSTLLFKEV
jgi:hypothetical protein